MFRGFRGYKREKIKEDNTTETCMQIKPNTNMTVEEAKAFWDRKFNSIDELPDEFDDGDEIDDLPEESDG